MDNTPTTSKNDKKTNQAENETSSTSQKQTKNDKKFKNAENDSHTSGEVDYWPCDFEGVIVDGVDLSMDDIPVEMEEMLVDRVRMAMLEHDSLPWIFSDDLDAQYMIGALLGNGFNDVIVAMVSHRVTMS